MQYHDIAILGNDPVARFFVEQARSRYERVFWSEDGGGMPPEQTGNRFYLIDEQTAAIEQAGTLHRIRADVIVLAPGAVPKRPVWMPEHERIQFGTAASHIPASTGRVAIVGCGRNGRAIADTMPETVEQLLWLEARRLTGEEQAALRLAAPACKIYDQTSVIAAETNGADVTLLLEDTRTVTADHVYVCCGTRGATAELGLEEVGLRADDAGKLWCNDDLQTWASGIYALGGIVGYPCETLSPAEQSDRILRSLAEQFQTLALAN